MITGLRTLLSKERELKMIWEVEREGKRSYLVGTAHFFPYEFKRSMVRYISDVETVLFEGPLDENAMSKVVECASEEEEGFSLCDSLDAQTIMKVNKELRSPSHGRSSYMLYRSLFDRDPDDLVCVQIKGLKPWMAFFRVWTRYLERNGWKYTMDLDASRIARALGKEVHFLERMEEQIEALNEIPLEQIVNFLGNMDWRRYRRDYVRHYVNGELDGLMTTVREFPTFCASIIDKRDPILYERMRSFFEKGNSIAFVGVLHCQGITARLLEDAYKVVSP